LKEPEKMNLKKRGEKEDYAPPLNPLPLREGK
jgi:hypothetical protein